MSSAPGGFGTSPVSAGFQTVEKNGQHQVVAVCRVGFESQHASLYRWGAGQPQHFLPGEVPAKTSLVLSAFDDPAGEVEEFVALLGDGGPAVLVQGAGQSRVLRGAQGQAGEQRREALPGVIAVQSGVRCRSVR